MNLERNPRLELAYNFVQFTDKNIFLTGKAGTGKTTFLRNLKKSSAKRMAIVAPTGVAAINAGGVTINSFFQFPFGPYIPGNTNKTVQQRFNREKINLLKSLDLLVIDEISMVRADTLDQIDEVLRKYRHSEKAFGGVQLLMIGDLHQLSPVVKEEDWRILKEFYPNLFFFSSRALSDSSPINIELNRIYRQDDDTFISILNQVRKNELTADGLFRLNQRYIPDFEPPEEEGYITLTTHNITAQQINEERLSSLAAVSKTFSAVISNDFPEYMYPTIAELELKVGAQVMFVKNDTGRDKLFYNGKIGVVQRIESDSVFVKCPGDLIEIEVSRLEWNNIRYELDPVSKEIKEKVIGSFLQLPLKLAWAITIHKSQGLTFERVVIDASLAFAHGQVYVALSRCKSLEGLVLRSPISVTSVRTDGTVAEFSRKADQQTPDEQQLLAARILFQHNLLLDLFDFKALKTLLFQFQKLAQDHYRSLIPGLYESLKALSDRSEQEITAVATTFIRQLNSLIAKDRYPEEDPNVMQRVSKACTYFLDKIEDIYNKNLSEISTDSDNKVVRESVEDLEAELKKQLAIKRTLLTLSGQQFTTLGYLQARANCEIELQKTKISARSTSTKVPSKIKHPELYTSLRFWRDNLAEEKGVPAYHILAQKSLLELLEKLPRTMRELTQIKGIGKIKAANYGVELLEMISGYCEMQNIEPAQPEHHPEKVVKPNTKQLSFELFKSGKNIYEIAAERGLTTGTVEGHLLNYILTGELRIEELLPKGKIELIENCFFKNPAANSTQVKEELGDLVSFNDIRAVKNHLNLISTDTGS